jgi:hypothetical protein
MCSTSGLRDFPIVNSVPVTSSLNASIYEETAFDIQWGPKATPPAFIPDGSKAGQGFLEYGSASSTTLRFNGNSFSLLSVQLCAPQHRSFLPQRLQQDVSGEIILGFKANTSIAEGYVFLCVPIRMGATPSPSVYLEALRQDRLDGKPTSLLSVFPSDTHFLSYSTCLRRREATSTTTHNARVLVFSEGLVYPAANFLEIARKIVTPPIASGARTFLPTIQLPDGLVDKSEATLYSLTTEVDYKSFLRYSQYYPKGQPDSSTQRKDSLDAYKCVPLEPSQNIKDGHIVVDTETGELLSQVVKEEEPGRVKKSSLSPALIEKIIAIGVALALVSFVFLILAYVLSNMVTPNADSFFGIVKQHTSTIAPIFFFSTLVGVICFILGILAPMLL